VAIAASLSPPALAQHTKLSLESIGPGGGNGGQSANLVGATTGGKRAIVTTAEPLVAADTDSSPDLYEHTGGGVTLLSTGLQGGNGAYPASFGATAEGGNTVYFQTQEQLVAGDTDNSVDVYRRSGVRFERSSCGPNGGNGGDDTYLAGATEDGNHVFMTTREALVSSDTDSAVDIYERSGGVVTLISTGPAGGNTGQGAEFIANSAGGQKVFFQTVES